MMLKEQRLSQKHIKRKSLFPEKCQRFLLYERASQGAQERKKRNMGKIKKQVMNF